MPQIIKSAFWKAIAACLLFILSYVFYNIEFIRANIEDIAFDVVNKIAINSYQQETSQAQVMLFTFDDAYMRSQNLIDKNNNSNYGYLFPRSRIAAFIEDVDELVSEMEAVNQPKALLIDYDISFTSLPYGKALSEDDIKLLDVLEKPRPYMILLTKTSDYNIIQTSTNEGIKTAIKEKRIDLVSVALLVSSDNIVRRYQSHKVFNQSEYQSAEVTLWQKLQDSNKIVPREPFQKDDTIGNRIWMKSYETRETDGDCVIDKSYWKKLSKYSVNCSLFDIPEEDFSGSVMLLGGTHSQNGDKFNVNPLNIINVSNNDLFSGLDIHGNALMTMLHLDGSMQRLSLWLSLLIVFFSFIFLSLLTSIFFYLFNLKNKSSEFLFMLLVNVIFLISISVYLLREHQLWFNWFIPLIFIELIESFNFIKFTASKVSRRKNV